MRICKANIFDRIVDNTESIFLTSGENKAETLKLVLEGKKRSKQYPAQMIEPVHERVLWFIDRTAARELKKSGRFPAVNRGDRETGVFLRHACASRHQTLP